MIKIGYVRVSREDQNVENQIKVFLDEGLPGRSIYVDHISASAAKAIELESPLWHD